MLAPPVNFKKFVFSLGAWQIIVLGFMNIAMTAHKSSISAENIRKLLITASLGLIVVLVLWPICPRIQKKMAGSLGFAVGLVVPALFVWLWSWSLPIPLWTDSFELKILASVISIPSAIGGAVAGTLQAKVSPQ